MEKLKKKQGYLVTNWEQGRSYTIVPRVTGHRVEFQSLVVLAYINCIIS